MNITEIKTILKASKTIAFKLPNGTLVPAHFHVTEIGKVHKDFIDCGGKRRQESKISFNCGKRMTTITVYTQKSLSAS